MSVGTDPIYRHFYEELLLVQTEIQEHGLAMVRKEIYENVGQVLSYVKLRLSDHALAGTDQLKQTMEVLKELVGQTIKDLRLASWPVSIAEIREKGLAAAIAHELSTFCRLANRTATFKAGEGIARFDPGREIIAFRIVQQLIGWLDQLSPVRPIDIRMDRQESGLCISLLCGAPALPEEPALFPGESCSDAAKIRERAGLIQATLRCSGKPDEDLAIHLLIPLNNQWQ